MAQLDFILNLKADALDKVEKRITRLEKNGINLKFNKASLEKELDNVVKAAQKKPVEVLNYSKRLGRIMDGFNYQVPKEPKDKNSNEWKTWKSKVEKAENSWFESIRSFAPEIEAINNFAKMFAKRLKQSEDVVFDMLKGLSAEKLEEFQLGMTGKGSSGEISKLVSAITKAQKTGKSKFSHEVNKELDAMKIARTADNTTTTSFRNAYIPNKNYTEEEKKAMIKVTSDGKAVSTDVKNYLELEVILGRITEKKKELNGQDLTDLGVLKQLVQVSADEANVRQRMAQLAKKGNIAKQSEKNGWDIKNIPEIDPYAVNLAITQAKNNYGAVMQSQLEKIADEAFGQLITKIQNMLNFSELSDSGVLDVFGDLAKIKDEARQFIETVNDLVVAEEKVKQANDKFKKDKLGFSVENAENAKELVGYLQRYVSLGGNLDDIAEKLNINKDLVESFKSGFKGKNEFIQMLRDTQSSVLEYKDNTIGQLVTNGIRSNVQPTSQTSKLGSSTVTGDDVNKTDLYTESLKRLGDEFKDVTKYAVDAETAISEIEKMMNSNKYDKKDFLGYYSRFKALSENGNTSKEQSDKWNNLEREHSLSGTYEMWFADNKTFASKVGKMTQAQLPIVEQLKMEAEQAKETSAAEDELNKTRTETSKGTVGGLSEGQLNSLISKLNEIIDKLNQIHEASNKEIKLFNEGDIEKFTQSMQNAINNLDFSKITENIGKINFKAISEDAEKAIKNIAKEFKNIGEIISESVSEGIKKGSETPIKDKTSEFMGKTVNYQDLEKVTEKYINLKKEIAQCDEELNKLKSQAEKNNIDKGEIDKIENYIEELKNVRDSGAAAYDTSSDDIANFVTKDNSDELNRLELSLENIVQECDLLKDFTFDFSEFSSAEEASENLEKALTTFLSGSNSELSSYTELNNQIGKLTSNRAAMSNQLNENENMIKSLQSSLGTEVTILDIDKEVNKLNILEQEIKDCEETIKSLKDTSSSSSVLSSSDIEQARQLLETFSTNKYKLGSYGGDAWDDFGTLLSKTNISNKDFLSNKATDVANNVMMRLKGDSSSVAIQKEIIEILKQEINEQEILSQKTDENAEKNIKLTNDKLVQLRQEKEETKALISLLQEKMKAQESSTKELDSISNIEDQIIKLNELKNLVMNEILPNIGKLTADETYKTVMFSDKFVGLNDVVNAFEKLCEAIDKVNSSDVHFTVNIKDVEQAISNVNSQISETFVNWQDLMTKRLGKQTVTYQGKTQDIENKMYEFGMFMNMENGKHTNPLLYDQEHQFSRERMLKGEWKNRGYNAFAHSHNREYAVPSKADIGVFISDREHNINKNFIVAQKDVLEFDISKITDTQLSKLKEALDQMCGEATEEYVKLFPEISQKAIGMLKKKDSKYAEKLDKRVIDGYSQKFANIGLDYSKSGLNEKEASKIKQEYDKGVKEILTNGFNDSVSGKMTLDTGAQLGKKIKELTEKSFTKNNIEFDQAYVDEWINKITSNFSSHILKALRNAVVTNYGGNAGFAFDSGSIRDKIAQDKMFTYLKENNLDGAVTKMSTKEFSDKYDIDLSPIKDSDQKVEKLKVDMSELKSTFEELNRVIGELKSTIENNLNLSDVTNTTNEAIKSIADKFEELSQTIGETIKAGMQQGIDEGTTNLVAESKPQTETPTASIADKKSISSDTDSSLNQIEHGLDSVKEKANQTSEALNTVYHFSKVPFDKFDKSQTETLTASNSAINAQKEELISLLKELKTLQDTIQDGKWFILPKYNRGILQDSYAGQIRKNSTTKTSIKNALRRYNDMKDDVDNGTYGIYDEESLQRQLQEIARYVAGYRSLDEAQTLFGKKNQDIWNQVVETINKAKAAQEAYDTYEARRFRITDFLNTDTMKFGDYSRIEKILRNGDIESAFNYVVEKYGLIQQASKDTTDKQVNQQGGTKTPKEETVVSNTTNTTALPPQSDNSQKILAEQQALEQLSQTLTTVINAIQAKTEAFVNEGTTVANTVQKEIAELNALDGMLQAVKREVDLITTAIATLPNINIKADLSNLNSGEISEEAIAKYGELAEKLKNIDTNNINIEGISALKELNLPETAGENLQKVANAINNIKASLNNLGEGGKSFIADIKEIVNAGEALKNFNEVLKKTKTEREQASKQVKGEEVFEPKNLTGTAKANSELITREMEEAMREISVNNQESVPINLSDDFKKASDQIILDMQRVQGEVQKVQFVTNSEYSGIATLLDDENIEAEIAGVQKLTGAIVTYKNELGEVITTTYSLQKKAVPVFDKDGNPVMEESNDSNKEPRQKKTTVSFFAQDQEKLSRKTIDAEKNKAAAIENTNVKLDRQLDKIKKVQSSYDQDLAPGLTKFVSKDTEDYKELSKMYASIEKKIASMRGKDVSKEEMSNLITMIADYERLAKIKIQANNVTKKEMGGQELKVAVKGLIEKYEQLIAKTSQYGEATKDITNHLKEQLELLKQSKTEGKDKISTDKFYEFQAGYKVDKAEFGARQPELNNEEDKINGYYTTMISNLRQIKTLKSELPKLDEKSAKEAKSQIKRLQEQVRYRRKIIEGLDLSTRARFSDKQKTIDNLNWQIGYQQKKINGKATAEDEKKAQRLAKEQADIQQKRDVQSAESKASFSKTEQKDYYDALTVSVKDYLNYLEKEKSATGELKEYYANLKNAAKDSIRSIREDMDKNNIRTDANKEADIVGMFNNSQNSIRENAAKRKQAENEAQEKMLEEAYRMNAEFDKKKKAQYEKDAQAYETAYTKAIQKVRDKRMKAFSDMAKKEQAESEKKAKSYYSYNQNKAYKDVNDLFSRYETVTKRMEKGESVDRRKDFEEASSLLTEIESKMEQIGKSGLYDSAKDDAVLRRWENLERVIDDIRAKVASDAWDNYYKDQSKQAEMIEEAYRMNDEFDKKKNSQAEKEANKFDADVDKQLAGSKEAQRKSTVSQAADIQKSVWESILQIRNEISKLELEDESANTDKITALKEEESILQAVYNDQERILRLNATKKEYSSQRDALSSLNSKAKNEEEKIITDAVKEESNLISEVNSKLEAQEKLLDQIAKKYAEIKKARAEGKDTSAMEKDLANLRNSYKSNTTELNSGKYDDVYSPDERRERLKTYASKDTKVEQANIDISEKQDKATNASNNKQIIEDYKELISLEKQLHELRTKESVGFNIDQEEISNLEEKIAAKKSEVESIVETTNMTDRAKKSQEDYNTTVKELQSIFAKNSNGIQNVPLADFSSRLETVKTQMPELEQEVSDAYDKINKLTESFSKGKISVTDYQKKIEDLVTNLERIEKVIQPGDMDEAKSALEELFRQKGAQVKSVKTSKDGNTLTFTGTQYDKATKQTKELVGTVDIATGHVRAFERRSSEAMSNFQKAVAGFRGKMGEVVRYFATFVSVYQVINAIKQAVQQVIEFDTALSEMRKVSSASVSSLKELQERSFEVANQVGSTALQIQKSTADFLRLGKPQQKLRLAPLYGNI